MPSSYLVSKQRVEALADGIYAIALTLLVLDLKLPPLNGGATEAALFQALVVLIPKALVWLLSFWVMAMYWLAQQRALRFFAALDSLALRIELFQLALVSLLPFSTALIGEEGHLVASAALYAGHLSLLAFLSLSRVLRLSHNPSLQSQEFNALVIKALIVRASVILGCSLLATGLAFAVPGWNMLALVLVAFFPAPGNPKNAEPANPPSHGDAQRRASGSGRVASAGTVPNMGVQLCG